jgi:hypothetical protein
VAAIDKIRIKLEHGEYEFAIPHFFEEMLNDRLAFEDVEQVIRRGKVRRKFTGEIRGTRYEVVGPTRDGRRAAVICRLKSTGKLLFITAYLVK